MLIGADQTPPRGDFVRYVDELLSEQQARQQAPRPGGEGRGRALAAPARAPAALPPAPPAGRAGEADGSAGPPDLREILARLGGKGRQLGVWAIVLVVLLAVTAPLLLGPLLVGLLLWLGWRGVRGAGTGRLRGRD